MAKYKKENKKQPVNVLSKKGLITLAMAGVMAVSPFMLTGCGEAGPAGKDGATGAQGATGANGKSAYELAVDSGFEGTLEEWLESLKGTSGTSTYTHIKYANEMPDSNEDILTGGAGDYIGVYTGTSETAPTDYTAYTWYKIKGEAGQTGTTSYIHIKYANEMPDSNEDILTSGTGDYMGVYVGSNATAPTDYTEYTWQKIVGEDGADGEAGKDGVDGVAGKDGTVLNNASFMHISFDDVQYCFNNLTSNTYDSLYDEPFFNWLKSMHDTYGAKFSLYAYNNALTNVPNTYADEFYQAKDWLKIGLHADSSSSNYGTSTYDEGKTAWNTFVNNVVRITGSYLNVDRMPRLHTFAGSEEALKGMRDANYGAIGFLSADDDRTSYYFDSETVDYLYTNDHITDHENALTFIATDLRADWFETFSTTNSYREPTKTTVYEELVERFTNPEYANSNSSYIFFGHEWLVYNGTTLDESKTLIEDACKFAGDYDIAFDFAQNKAFNPTAGDIYPAGTTTDGNTDEEQVATTVMYYETEMQIVNSISEMSFNPDYTIVGGATSDFTIATVDGRATCVTAVLEVNGGETIGFVDNLAEVFGSTDLSWALIEFSSAPLSKETMSFPNVSSLSATAEQKPACGYAWLTENHTLQSNTRYIILSFKNGDGSTDFTTEQLAVLNQCLTIIS